MKSCRNADPVSESRGAEASGAREDREICERRWPELMTRAVSTVQTGLKTWRHSPGCGLLLINNENPVTRLKKPTSVRIMKLFDSVNVCPTLTPTGEVRLLSVGWLVSALLLHCLHHHLHHHGDRCPLSLHYPVSLSTNTSAVDHSSLALSFHPPLPFALYRGTPASVLGGHLSQQHLLQPLRQSVRLVSTRLVGGAGPVRPHPLRQRLYQREGKVCCLSCLSCLSCLCCLCCLCCLRILLSLLWWIVFSCSVSTDPEDTSSTTRPLHLVLL